MSAHAVTQLKALAHPLRMRIVDVLRQGEHNVGEIEQAAQIGQPALSQQLGVLRKAGLVETRRDAKLVYYRLNTPDMAGLAELLAGLAPVEAQAEALPQGSARRASQGAANFARLS